MLRGTNWTHSYVHVVTCRSAPSPIPPRLRTFPVSYAVSFSGWETCTDTVLAGEFVPSHNVILIELRLKCCCIHLVLN